MFNFILLGFFYIIQSQQQSCTISGTLFTPKQYPASNVLVTFQPIQPKLVNVNSQAQNQINMTTLIDGKFLLQFTATATQQGQLQLNLANQYYKQINIEFNAGNRFTNNLGDIVLNNGEQEQTNIYGCVYGQDTQKPVTQAKVTAFYDKPTKLDQQTQMTNQDGCFNFTDQLMKLLIYQVDILIEATGYQPYTCEPGQTQCGIILYNTYKYAYPKNIILIPYYVKIKLSIQVFDKKQTAIHNSLVSISCQYTGLIAYSDSFLSDDRGYVNVDLQSTFKQGITYTCLAIGTYLEQVGIFTFLIPSQPVITGSIVISPFQAQNYLDQSHVNGQVISASTRNVLPDVEISCTLSPINNQQTITSNNQGNFSILVDRQYLDVKNKNFLQLTFTLKGYQTSSLNVQLPVAPFTLYLPQIQMTVLPPPTTYQSYVITIQGVIKTRFNDPIYDIQFLTQCILFPGANPNKYSVTSSKPGGSFTIIFDSIKVQDSYKCTCQILAQNSEFKDQSWTFDLQNQKITSQQLIFSQPQLKNDVIQASSLNNVFQITPLTKSLAISGSIDHPPQDLTFYVWLSNVYYPTDTQNTALAQPNLNQTLQIGANQKVNENGQIYINLSVDEFYIYELYMEVLDSGKQQVYTTTKNSSQDTSIKLGGIHTIIPSSSSSSIISSISSSSISSISSSSKSSISSSISSISSISSSSSSFSQSSRSIPSIQPTSSSSEGLSSFYTSYTGKVDQLQNPQCPTSVQTWIAGVDIKFYYQIYLANYVQQTYLVNQTSTDHMGQFELVVDHPRLIGEYTGIIHLIKDGYVQNQVMININVEQGDYSNVINVGTLQMMGYKGPAPCVN